MNIFFVEGDFSRDVKSFSRIFFFKEGRAQFLSIITLNFFNTQHATQKSFQRTIGLFPAISLVITVLFGSGIFMRPAEMAALLGSPGCCILSWICRFIYVV
jgi:hypothetical protein